MDQTHKQTHFKQVPWYFRLLAKFLLRLWGWKIIGDSRQHAKAVFITQHTTNWDGILTLASAYSVGIRPRWIGKKELFDKGRRGFMKMTGGIEVNRHYLDSFVEDVMTVLEGEPPVWIYIAPEGTRKKVKYWKEGFYLIANQAQIPIVQGYLNYKTKEVGIGHHIIPSGVIYADMEIIRGWFANSCPKYPENTGEIRVKIRRDKALR